MAYWNAKCRVCKTEQPGSFHPGENRWKNSDWYALLLVLWFKKLVEELGAPLSSVSTLSAPAWLFTKHTIAYLAVPVTCKRKMLGRGPASIGHLCTC